MAASKDHGNTLPAAHPDPDVDFAGYDPYIVAITAADHRDASHLPGHDPAEATESRKVQLMAWLRANGA
jgi:hypothetical protein